MVYGHPLSSIQHPLEDPGYHTSQITTNIAEPTQPRYRFLGFRNPVSAANLEVKKYT